SPLGSITVVRTLPSRTSAHSAAVACQCSSRIAPGSSFMETPAMPLEIGNCVTVASLPKLLPITLPCDCSNANLKVGSAFSASAGSGTLFMKEGPPAVSGLRSRARIDKHDKRRSHQFNRTSEKLSRAVHFHSRPTHHRTQFPRRRGRLLRHGCGLPGCLWQAGSVL